MTFIVPKEGRLSALEGLRSSPLGSAACVLFENDLTPDADTVLADLDEPTWTGYSRLALSGWSDPALTADDHAVTVAGTVTWTKTDSGSADVYGYAVIDSDDKILGIERFASAPVSVDQLIPFPLAVSYLLTSEE